MPTVPAGWRKPVPTDPTSPWWYDDAALKRLVFAHIAKARSGGRDLTLGEFVRMFKGLTSTIKAGKVCRAVPQIRRLSDFYGREGAISDLLKAMQAETKTPNPKTLGWGVDGEHYRKLLDAAYGVRRSWFKRAMVLHAGVPWVVEAFVAVTHDESGVRYHAVNYSPTFTDPLARTNLESPEFYAQGTASFLMQADATGDHRAAVVHVVCPSVEFMDRGKSSLTVPREVADAISKVLWDCTKELHRERKRRERDAQAQARRDREREREHRETLSLKDAVFRVMEKAIEDASGGGAYPFPTRNLYYAVRPLLKGLTDRELTGVYFSQTLVVEYEREHGPIPGHYRDPRGHLMEPHTGKVVPLGTREIADYIVPAWTYNKILYVEKEGFGPIFQAARLAERYDMAIASGKGQPVEAVRALFQRVEAGGNIDLFVLHDADDSGYCIARTIAEETDRMPDYHVTVHDLGLTVAQAVERGLLTEGYTRRKELPWWMPERLTAQEREWFDPPSVYAGVKQWTCTRVELNALKGQLVPFIEGELERLGMTAKVVPPTDVLAERARKEHREQVAERLAAYMAERFDTTAMVNDLVKAFALPKDVDLTKVVNDGHERDPVLWWKEVIEQDVDTRLSEAAEAFRDKADELLRQRLEDEDPTAA